MKIKKDEIKEINWCLTEAIKQLSDNPLKAIELLEGAKSKLSKIPGNLSAVYAVRALAIAIEIRTGKRKKEDTLKDILQLANEIKMKGM